MGKTRFTRLDTRAQISCLRNMVVGSRVTNIYDLGPKIYLLKMGRTDAKHFILLESGTKIHTTTFAREKSAMPNPFSQKLRKALRGKKLNSIRQIGRDRVVELSFGTEERTLNLILEMYNKGNIILTDVNYVIMACLRPAENVQIRNVFSYENILNGPCLQKEEISSKLIDYWKKKNLEPEIVEEENPPVEDASTNNKKKKGKQKGKTKKKKKKKKKKKTLLLDWCNQTFQSSPATSKHCLLSADPAFDLAYPLDDCFIFDSTTTDPTTTTSSDPPQPQQQLPTAVTPEIIQLLETTWDVFEQLLQVVTDDTPRGYIIQKRVQIQEEEVMAAKVKSRRQKEEAEKIVIDAVTGSLAVAATKKPVAQIPVEAEATSSSNNITTVTELKPEVIPTDIGVEGNKAAESEVENYRLVYDNVVSFLPAEIDSELIITYSTFNEALDEFFSKMEEIRLEKRVNKVENTALSKLLRSQQQHEDRVRQLEDSISNNEFIAHLIEEHMETVDHCIIATNDLVTQGMDWHAIGMRIAEEKSRGNPVAEHIHNLDLVNNKITLKLPHKILNTTENLEDEGDDSDFGSDDESNDFTIEYHKVQIKLELSAMQNAGFYYHKKKKNQVKKQKTEDASSKATKAAQKNMVKDLKLKQDIATIEKMRRVHWFEKFHWFISSDNYLVIGGTDAQQNEMIVKKYLDPQRDIYVHANIHGASSVVIKNPTGLPVSVRTLNEAGWFCACRSKAWDNGTTVQTYWVFGHQVSKTPNSGEYLPTGSFVIRGKRNFMPQQPLLMGLGLLFCIDLESFARNHEFDRCINPELEEGPNITLSPCSSNLSEESTEIQPPEAYLNLTASERTAVTELFARTDLTWTEKEELFVTSYKLEEDRIDSIVEYFTILEEAQQSSDLNPPSMSPEISNLSMASAMSMEEIYANKEEEYVGVLPTTIDYHRKRERLKQKSKNEGAAAEVPHKPKSLMTKTEKRELRKAKRKRKNQSKQSTNTTTNNNDNNNSGGKNNKSQPKKKTQELSRGQKRKRKKLKKKYGKYLMDDEDMSIMEQVLGTKRMNTAAEQYETTAEAVEQNEEQPPPPEDIQPVEHPEDEVVRMEATSTNDDYTEQDTLIDREEIERQELLRQEEEEEARIRRLAELEEEIENRKMTIAENLTDQVNQLTGCPKQDDNIFYAIPVCAPYYALSKYTFKVKVQPGTQKRGKAIKSIYSMFNGQCHKETPNFLGFIDALKEQDGIQCFVSNVKVVGAKGNRGKGRGKKQKNKQKQKQKQQQKQNKGKKCGKKKKK